MTIKKSDLYSSPWVSYDKFCAGMDARQYKNYLLSLPLITYGTLSLFA
jgi:hypothetical protein